MPSTPEEAKALTGRARALADILSEHPKPWLHRFGMTDKNCSLIDAKGEPISTFNLHLLAIIAAGGTE